MSKLVIVRHYEPPDEPAEAEDLHRRVVTCLLAGADLTHLEPEDTIDVGEGQHESS